MCHLQTRLILIAIVIVPSPAIAHGGPNSDAEGSWDVGRKLSVGIAVGIERFDTNFKFTEKSTGRSAFTTRKLSR